MRSKKVQLKLSHDLLEAIDGAARTHFQSRSQFIRESITLRLNDQRITKNQSAEEIWQEILKQSDLLDDGDD